MYRRNVATQPEKNISACEEFFSLIVERHICTAAIQLFNMSSPDYEPSLQYFPQESVKLTSQHRWKLAIKKINDSFVDISCPKASTEEDEDNVCAYAKEAMS